MRRAEEADRDELTVLCLKERARKRAGDDFVTDAHYTCCDMQAFHELVLDYFYGTQQPERARRRGSPPRSRCCAAALALCRLRLCRGQGPPRRPRAARWCARWCATHPQDAGATWPPVRSGAALQESQALARRARTLSSAYAKSLEDVPRMKKAKDNASNYCQAQLLPRALDVLLLAPEGAQGLLQVGLLVYLWVTGCGNRLPAAHLSLYEC